MIEFLKILVIAVIIAFLITRVTVKTVVHGRSMNPTLHDGESYFLNKLSYSFNAPGRNDFVVFKPQHKDKIVDIFYIKRVVATEGDTIYISDNKVFVNGEELYEPYINEPMITEDMDEIKLEIGEIFVMGDNRNNSIDSRVLGPVKVNTIYGKLIIKKER